MRNILRNAALFFAVVAFALTSSAVAAPVQEITIGLSSATFGTAAARVAKEMGLYEKYGLEPKFVVLDNSGVATSAVISGSLKFALSGPSDMIVAQAHGQKVAVVTTTYAGSAGTLVLSKKVADRLAVLPSAPVAERLKALDGLVIALTGASGVTPVSFRSAAKAAGAAPRFTYIAQPAMPAALANGAIDGFVASAPVWAQPVLKGTGVLWISGPRGDLPEAFTPAASGDMQTMRSTAEANPELMLKLVAVFADFARAVDERPDAVKAGVAKLFPDLDAATLELLFASESRAWRVKPPTLAEMAHEIAFMKASGVDIPDIDKVDPASMLLR